MKEAVLSTVMLKPGELVFSMEPVIVHTVLGSCVSVVMFSRLLHAGAICHAMRSRTSAERGRSFYQGAGPDEEFKYVDVSIDYMLKRFKALGAVMEEIDVMVYGGSTLIDDRYGLKVGAENVKNAYAIIADRGLRIVSSDTGGSMGRKLFFNTCTGEVFLQYMVRPAQ